MPWSVCLPSLALIDQAVFLLERKRTDQRTERQTETDRQTHKVTAGANDQATRAAGVVIKMALVMNVIKEHQNITICFRKEECTHVMVTVKHRIQRRSVS